MFNAKLKEKRFVQMYQTNKECFLSHTDILIISYLCYKSEYASAIPAKTLIASHTGIHRNTVSNAIKKFEELGFIANDRIHIPEIHKNIFRAKNRNNGHWSKGFFMIPVYVRNNIEGNPLTVSCCSVISYLWYCFVNDSYPKYGLSDSYIASLLNINRETVSKCLKTLEDNRFLKITDDGNFALNSNLSDDQLNCFQSIHDKPEIKKRVCESFSFDDNTEDTVIIQDEEITENQSCDIIEHSILSVNEIEPPEKSEVINNLKRFRNIDHDQVAEAFLDITTDFAEWETSINLFASTYIYQDSNYAIKQSGAVGSSSKTNGVAFSRTNKSSN